MQRLRFWIFFASLAVLALILVVPGLFGVLTDWWWFREIGYQVVFTKRLSTEGWLFLIGAVVTFVVLWANLVGSILPIILFRLKQSHLMKRVRNIGPLLLSQEPLLELAS